MKQKQRTYNSTATATKRIGECVLATEGLEPPVACHPAGHATDRQARLVTAYHKAMGGEAVGVCVCVCGGGGVGIGNVEEVVKMTGVTGQHTH